MISDITSHIPDQDTLEQRFSFIRDPILLPNIVIAFRYVIFLMALESKETWPSAIRYSIYKDIILHTASVVESCIHYCLKMRIEKGFLSSSDVMPTEWKDEKTVILHKLSPDHLVCGVVRHRIPERFTSQTQFKTMNEMILHAKIFDRNLFEKSEKIRQLRNTIHLAGLENTEDYYQKRDVDMVFAMAKEILDKIEDTLSTP